MSHGTSSSSRQNMDELDTLRVTLTRPGTRLHNSEVTDTPSSEGYAQEIESEANSYFQKMFSGQLTIDVMVQMLTRFKESSLKRCACNSGCCSLFLFINFGSFIYWKNLISVDI